MTGEGGAGSAVTAHISRLGTQVRGPPQRFPLWYGVCRRRAAAAARVGTPSLPSAEATWWSTVLAEMNSRAAISAW